MLSCFLVCFVCLCAYSTETNDSTKTAGMGKATKVKTADKNGKVKGHSTNQAKLYGSQNNYDSQNGLVDNKPVEVDSSDVQQAGDSVQDAVQRENGYIVQNVQEKSCDSDSFSLFDYMSLLALVLSVVSLIITYKRKDKYERNEEIDQVKRQFRDVKNKIDNQDSCLTHIQNKINELRLVRQKENVNMKNHTGRVNDTHISTSVKKKEDIRYCTTIKGNLFPNIGIKDISDDFTICVLTLSGDYGTFVVNDASEAQQKILSQFNYGLSGIVNVKAKNLSPKAVKTIKIGKLRKMSDGWQVTEKADVELC